MEGFHNAFDITMSLQALTDNEETKMTQKTTDEIRAPSLWRSILSVILPRALFN